MVAATLELKLDADAQGRWVLKDRALSTGEELNKTKSQLRLEREIAKRAGKPESVAVTMRAN